MRRLSARTVCEKCQTPYTGREPGTACDKCGGTLVRRKDDEPEAIRNAACACIDEQTAPVLDVVRANGTKVARRSDAVGTRVHDVTPWATSTHSRKIVMQELERMIAAEVARARSS